MDNFYALNNTLFLTLTCKLYLTFYLQYVMPCTTFQFRLNAVVRFRIFHFLLDKVTTGCHDWTNNACESINLLKLTVQWLPNKLPVYIQYLWPISLIHPMQCFYTPHIDSIKLW